jgi:FkbM family methyltransferase
LNVRQAATSAYVWVRRGVRKVVIRSPLLDETVGRLLRWVEQRLVGASVAKEQARRGGGVIRVRGVTLYYREQDLGVVGQLLMYQDYEPETREVIEAMLTPGMCFVDLGAHIGFLSLVAARRVLPNGRVHAFEPIDATADLLAKNVDTNGFEKVVTIVREAISDRPKELAFTISSEHSVSNKMARAASKPGETITLHATSLDTYFEALGWPTVNLIKMDVEGAELDAMRGMSELSRRNADLKLIFEFHHANLRQMGINAEALFGELADLGFTRFTRLHRAPTVIVIPDDIADTVTLSRRVNFNILCEKV